VKPYLDLVGDIIYDLFFSLNGLMRLYDIKDEYEIYSGNISSLIKGDGIHKKVLIMDIYRKQNYNVENI
jgi:hypothetical protein